MRVEAEGLVLTTEKFEELPDHPWFASIETDLSFGVANSARCETEADAVTSVICNLEYRISGLEDAARAELSKQGE